MPELKKEKPESTGSSRLRFILWPLLQPWALVDFSWGIFQSLAGLVLAVLSGLLGARLIPIPGHCLIVASSRLMPAHSGMSQGPYLLGGPGFDFWTHEYGHTYQSRLLGPFYLLIIGIPSLLSASLRPSRHGAVYTERWADAWAAKGEVALRMKQAARNQSA
ncbi:MAG: hypothetical protein KDK23_17540 [Leptospiraceae bacterium]|nr:hypothetical protein [Leptospiraceae bacterium]